MGGDFAPRTVVLGAISASRKLARDSRIVLFGDKSRIEEILAEENCPAGTFDIVHTSEVIEMGDNPTQAFSKKTDSSIVVGFNHLLEGKIDGFASAGSTGAMMVGCMYTVKQIEGVIRPTISALFPTIDGSEALLLDVGLNVDCKPDVLYQYGIIGSTYAKSVMGKANPRVALLNIGEEKEKGNQQTKATYELMDNSTDFNFVGNTILKMSEGIFEMTRQQGLKNTYFENLNYEKVGGTPVLGINSTVIIGHGCSSATAIENMVLQTEKTIKAGVAAKLREIFS